jgi:hypothetical protein
MNRKLTRMLLVLSALAAVVYLWCDHIVGAPIQWTAFFRVQQGVSRAEVGSLLGKPTRIAGDMLIWDGSNGTVAVAFDQLGMVRARYHTKDRSLGIRRLLGKLGVPEAWRGFIKAWADT